MRAVQFKVRGNIVEDRLILAVQEKIRDWEGCDIREINLYIPSLRAGMDRRIPSTATFILVAPRDIMDGLLSRAERFMSESGVEILEKKEIPYSMS